MLQQPNGSAVDVIKWNTGQTSTFTSTYFASQGNGTLTIQQTGSITAGKFAGATAIQFVTGPTLDLFACASAPGVTAQNATVNS